MCICVSFVLGMYVLSVFNFISVLYVSLALLFVLSLMLIRKIKTKRTILLLLCVLMFLSGGTLFDLENSVSGKKLNDYIGKTVCFKAEVLEEPIVSKENISFIANIIYIDYNNELININEKVKFLKYNEKENDDIIKALKIGDTIKSKCKITLPSETMNNGGFNYANHLKSSGIFFQCSVENADIELCERINRPVLLTWTTFRKKCISFFDESFPSEEGSILKAFITGDKSTISEEISTSFSNSGLSHVLSVSGLHVSVFVSLIASLLKLFNVSKRNEMLFCSIGAIFFVFFTGASVSALRAGILCVFSFIAKLIYRKSDPITTLSLAAVFLCLFNPCVIFSVSFMLSFAATAGILVFYKPISDFFAKIYMNKDTKTVIYKVSRNICDSIAVGLSAQIFVTPLLVYIFNGFSIMSLLSTMLVTPFLNFLLAGGILFIILSFISSSIALPVGGFIFLLAKTMLAISDFLGGFSFSKILFGKISPFLILMYALIIFTLYYAIRKNKFKYLVGILSITILSVFCLINTCINYNTASVSFINVGQGDCALFKAPGDCDILLDAGGYSHSKNTGKYIIAPYLIKNGVTDIEYVLVSHMHSDHIIGLTDLMDIIKIENIIIPYRQIDTDDGRSIVKKANEKGIKITCFTAGDVLEVNEYIKITALSPDGEQSKYSKEDNNMGIVARIDYGESSFMFTGDIDSSIEKYLIKKYPDRLSADVLKVAHHGSKYSNCKEFINEVNPKYAYIPVGNNTYGHPTNEAITNLKDNGTDVYRADIHRDVTFYFDSEAIKGVVYYN